jgi:hypothetical protein
MRGERAGARPRVKDRQNEAPGPRKSCYFNDVASANGKLQNVRRRSRAISRGPLRSKLGDDDVPRADANLTSSGAALDQIARVEYASRRELLSDSEDVEV